MSLKIAIVQIDQHTSQEVKQALYVSGGAALWMATSLEQFDIFKQMLPESVQSLFEHPDDKVVLIDQDLYNTLTEVEYQALLLHEEGHYVAGDLDVLQDLTVDEINARERLADDYAIKGVGALPMLNALRKLYAHTRVCVPKILQLMDFEYDEELCRDIMNQVEKNDPRIHRLETMCHAIRTN